MDANAVERALQAIVPTASPAQLMDAVVQHAVAVGKTDPHRKKRRATRRHGAYVRKRELDQSRQYNLRLDLMDLQRQINALAQLRGVLRAQTLNACDAIDGSFVRTASVYYDIMARGFRDFVVHGTTRIDTHAYLGAAMHDNVAIGRFVGRHHFPTMMQRYTTFFADNRLRLVHAQVLVPSAVPVDGSDGTNGTNTAEVIVRTTGAYSARLTWRTVQALFPHIADGTHGHLVQQLLARPLEGESTFDFVFDRTSGRVVRFDADMNFLPAFLRLVPDPDELALLLSQAKISEEMFIGELDELDDTSTHVRSDGEDDGTSQATWSPGSPWSEMEPDTVDAVDAASSPRGSTTVSRHLKMTDLLSPEDDDDVVERARRPSLST